MVAGHLLVFLEVVLEAVLEAAVEQFEPREHHHLLWAHARVHQLFEQEHQLVGPVQYLFEAVVKVVCLVCLARIQPDSQYLI